MKKTYQLDLTPINGTGEIIQSADLRTIYNIAVSEARAAGANLSKPTFLHIYEVVWDYFEGKRSQPTDCTISNIDGTVLLCYHGRCIILRKGPNYV